MDFITAVQSHLLEESEGQIIPYILEKVCWIVENDLLENGADLKFKEYAVSLALDVLASTLIDKIRNLPASKQSEKTLLISYYIRLLASPNNFEQLKEMVVS